jgi:hypothetical protein
MEILKKMKVCKKHLKYVAVGTTYQIVSMNDCPMCRDNRITRIEEL